jgi:hypothetical protein
MADRSAGRRANPPKLKKEQSAALPLSSRATTPPRTGNPNVRSHLEKGISELQRLHTLLLSNEVDLDVLADFRDALNRVRNTAWAAQQYIVRKETNQESTSLLSLIAGERIRAAFQLCQALSDDLQRTDVEFQRGSLVQLRQVTKTLTEQLKDAINKL